MEQWETRQTIYEGKVFRVESGRVRLADGATAQRDVVRHNGGVTVVAVTDGQVVMIHQFRVVIGESLLELPAGMIEGDEDPQMRAATELLEETGYRAGRLELLADYFVSPGYTTERMRIYLAEELTFEGQVPDDDEQIEVRLMPVADVRRALVEGAVRDAKTIIGLHAFFARLKA